MYKKILFSLLIAALLLTSLPLYDGKIVVASTIQSTFYVSTTGSDNNPGTFSQPFLRVSKARDAVRLINGNMTGDIIIYLRGGTYSLSETIELGDEDSGTNGYDIIYRNYPDEVPVLSGGQSITGWTLHDVNLNIWEASVGQLDTRQIYVNGTRATRARSEGELPGAQKTSTGYTTTNSNMQNWGNKSDIEFVDTADWKEFRCGVESIVGNTIILKTPCWTNTQWGNWIMNVPDFIENAYELLDQPGEWYLDKTADTIYYKPRSGEDMSQASVVAGRLEKIIDGTGTEESFIHNIKFQGITFSYTTWLKPNTDVGYACAQAGFCIASDATNKTFLDNWLWERTPGAVMFAYAEKIRFERNRFIHLGAVGLDFTFACTGNTISGNEFTDISSSGIQMGGVTWDDVYPPDDSLITKDNNITNNYIHNIGVEYRDAVGIWLGYTDNSLVSHNEICDLPYTGISVGWGWAFENTPCKRNKVLYNHIYNVMNYMRDGGCIYTIGVQPETIIEGNVCHDLNEDFAAIYIDDASSHITVRNNVLYNNPRSFYLKGINHDVEFNYISCFDGNTDFFTQTYSVVGNNIPIESGNVPGEILDQAGLELQYMDLLSTPSVNIALGKVVTAYYNDGSIATMHTGREAEKANDGKFSTWAQADGQHAWILEVDLGDVYNVERVKTISELTNTLWATEYEIQASTTGTNFTVVKTVTGCMAGISDQTFNQVQVRYIRIRAIKPDGYGQTGGQMAIAEFEIYGLKTQAASSLVVSQPQNNIALNKPATAYYADGSPATMHTGYEADKAVDGSYDSRAHADLQIKWTLQVDLGDIYNVETVNTAFEQGYAGFYATDFEIQASTDGSSFTTVRTITGFTGGTSRETFDPVPARYIRIKAIKPDDYGQPGNQMAITELEVYENSYPSYAKQASALWLDGSPAALHGGILPAVMVDGITEGHVYAQANGQYRWMLEVDMGAVFWVNTIDVVFCDWLWASQYEIQFSTTGGQGSFTTVATPTVTEYSNRTVKGDMISHVDIQSQEARFVRIVAVTPDGPDQPGGQMAIEELVVTKTTDSAIELSQKTNNLAGIDKYYYRSISSNSFTFQAGDIISYDVKLLTDSPSIGGLDIENTDATRFKDTSWVDQNGVSGNPGEDLTEYAYKKWYRRYLTVPASMAGKTASYWMLGFENDSSSQILQAKYDNIVVIRSGTIVQVIYKNDVPTTDSLRYVNGFSTNSGASVVLHN